jgi:hypothetical protein
LSQAGRCGDFHYATCVSLGAFHLRDREGRERFHGKAGDGGRPDFATHAATVTAPELVDLSKIFATVRDGEATWADVLEARLDMLAERAAAVATEKPSDPVTAPKSVPAESPRSTQPKDIAGTDRAAAARQAATDAGHDVAKIEARISETEKREKQGTFDQAAANARAADAAREAAAVAERQSRERAASAPPTASKGASAAKAALANKKPAAAPPARQEPPPQRDIPPSDEEPEWMRSGGGYKSVDEDPV